MDKYNYSLKIPVTDEKGFEIKDLTIRQATVADLIASEELSKNSLEQKRSVNFFSILSGQSPQSLEKIYLRDWLSFVKGANDFLGLDTSP